MQAGISAFLLASWLYLNPILRKDTSLLTQFSRGDALNAAMLFGMTIQGLVNAFYIGPKTTQSVLFPIT